MKKDELTEAQECAYQYIMDLCAEFGQANWFRRDEMKWVIEPTLDSLAKQGYLISKYYENNKSTYWQWTGKVYAKPERCQFCRSLITDKNKVLDDGKCASCDKKYAEWEKKEKRRRMGW
jgi:hypothetical protein